MSRSRIALGVVVLVLSIIATAAFFLRTPQSQEQSNTISVYASFYPLANIARVVGGNLVTVHDILPPGGEPHDFEPSPRDLAALGDAKVLFYNGASLEPWVSKWQAGAFTKPHTIVNMADALASHGVTFMETSGATDPHLWVSPAIYAKEVEVVRDTLAALDPAQRSTYEANAADYIGRLENLDAQFRTGLADCALRTIVTSHDAFAYLGREYDFDQVAIAGMSPDEEPSPKELANIATIAKDKNVKYIFFESTVSPKLSETIASEIGADTLVLNPLETLTTDNIQAGEDYVSMMLMNLNNLRKAFICQ